MKVFTVHDDGPRAGIEMYEIARLAWLVRRVGDVTLLATRDLAAAVPGVGEKHAVRRASLARLRASCFLLTPERIWDCSCALILLVTGSRSTLRVLGEEDAVARLAFGTGRHGDASATLTLLLCREGAEVSVRVPGSHSPGTLWRYTWDGTDVRTETRAAAESAECFDDLKSL